MQLNLIDSHDTPRFITTAGGDISALKLAYLFLFTYVGAPCIYYGDEIGLTGGPDPECRKAFSWDEETWNQDLLGFMKALVQLRKNEAALRRGSYNRIYSDADVIIFCRQYNEETLFIAINTSAAVSEVNTPIASINLSDSSLKTLFGNASASITDGMMLNLELQARSGVVLKA